MSIELINLSMVKLGMVFAQMTERYKALYILVVDRKGVRSWVKEAGIADPN